MRFVDEALREEVPISRLCEPYGISRETGYKWLRRFAQEGVAGLADRSHAPLTHPQAIDPKIADLLVETREAHPSWGPRTILARLARRGHDDLPAASTVGDLLKRRGLVKPGSRQRRPHRPPCEGRAPCEGPNDVWSVDFKGQFRLGDGECATR